MGVTVINKPYNYARAGLFNSAFNILGDQIGRMSDRAHEAAQTEKWRKGMKHVAEAGTPVQGAPYPEMVADSGQGYFGDALSNTYAGGEQANNFGRALWSSTPGLGKSQGGTRHDVARALGEYGSPQLFKDSMEYYKDIFANQEKEDYANRIRANFLANGGYDRNNESQNLANIAALEAAGLTPGNYLSHSAPNYNFSETNLGGKKVITSQNPLTGGVSEAYSGDVTISPGEQLEADTVRRGQNLSYAASTQPSYSTYSDENGQTHVLNSRTGQMSPVPGVKAPGKPIPTKDMLTIAKQILPMVQGASTPEEVWNMLESFSGGNQQTLRLMADVVFGMQAIPIDGYESTDNKFYGQYPAQYQQISGGNIVPQPPLAPTQPQGNGYGGYSEEQIQAAQQKFGFSREQIIAQINLEMAQKH